MTNENMLNVIKRRGIGEYLRKIKTNLGERNGHSAYVQICSTNENEYFVYLFTNPYTKYLKNEGFPYFKIHLTNKNRNSLYACLYKGQDKHKADKILNEIVGRDIKIKENLIHKIFPKN